MSDETKITGRPGAHTPDLALEICLRLAEGQTLREICRDERMPGRTTVTRWIVEDREGFRGQYVRAREAQADAWADENIEIADDSTNDWVERQKGEQAVTELDREHISRSALRIETRKWHMSRMSPKKWGDRTQLQHTGADGGPIQIEGAVGLSGLLTAARAANGGDAEG